MNRTRNRTRNRERKTDPNFFMGFAAVPLYLMTSYLYYEREVSAISDAEFDSLCVHLLDNWDGIRHPHKGLIDRDSLRAGTGYGIDWGEAPQRICSAAETFAKERGVL